MSASTNNYLNRGVSASKEEVLNAVKNNDKGLYEHSFCTILPFTLLTKEKWGVIAHPDGAGTKSSLAYIYWRETGDTSVFRGLPQDSMVMNFDDVMCAGAIGPDALMYLTSTIGRNKFRIPGDVLNELIGGQNDFLAKMHGFGVNAVLGGGETADVGDLVQTLIVDHSLTCIMPLRNVIDNGNIRPGDYIVGLASYGQATYETEYNSGMGSNGLTSGRHDIFAPIYRKKYPESYDKKNLDKNPRNKLSYRGSKRLTETIEIDHNGVKFTVPYGKLVLSPTRTYMPIVRSLYDKEIMGAGNIHGMVHCSGGAQSKVLNYLSEAMCIVKDNMLPIPPLFTEIQKESGTSWHEMYKVFNMGHRLEFYVPSEKIANEIIAASKAFNVDAQIIGRVEPAREKNLREVIVRSMGRELVYPQHAA
ncbi:MAG: AIR synthase-related protein [Proteobacteria bacterium]|nr:AIR synthase-related protein [Pseudomonadota bacterium]